MNCNNQPKCEKPCGDCTQEWPRPAGAQAPAEGAVVPVSTLARMFESERTDPNQPGHQWAKGWNAALRRAMDYARPNVQPKGREAIEWQSGPNKFKDWCAQWFGPDADDAYLARAVASFPAGQPTMGELPPQIAIDKAKAAMGYSQAFDGKGIDWQSGEPWPHRIELAQALDWITDLGAVILNLADRVVPPLVIQSPAPAHAPGHVAWVVRKPGGYCEVGYQSSVLNKLEHGTPLYTAPKSGSFMTREQAIAHCRNRRPGIQPTEQHIAATIDAYSALFGDLAPAESASTAVAHGWQPIETAPKDGRKLILFYLNRNGKARTVMACWVTDEEAAETDVHGVDLKGGWYERIDNWDEYSQVTLTEGEPSHWLPLPAAPVERCPDCRYQHGHAIGCERNPVDMALRDASQPPVQHKEGA